jgi:hypothetical protein
MGEGASIVLNHSGQVTAAKCLDGSWLICIWLKEANPNVVTIARTLKDRPPRPYNAEQWWNEIKNSLPAGFDYYEIENEITPPDEEWDQWVQFSIQMAQLVQRDKGGAMLAFSFGPGNPDLHQWIKLVPYMQWADSHPLPNGHYHGIAFHSSAYATFTPPAEGSWINNPYLTPDRVFVMARAMVLSATGYDMLKSKLTWADTEVGLDDGYSGSWGYPWTCEQTANAYRTTRARLQTYADTYGLHILFTWWNVGRISVWSSDHDCVPLMLRQQGEERGA